MMLVARSPEAQGNLSGATQGDPLASIREPLSHQQPAYLQTTGRTRSRSSPRSEPRVLVGRYSAGGCFKQPPFAHPETCKG